jgi:hypothetical protein
MKSLKMQKGQSEAVSVSSRTKWQNRWLIDCWFRNVQRQIWHAYSWWWKYRIKFRRKKKKKTNKDKRKKSTTATTITTTKPTINQTSILSFCSTWNTYNKMCFCPNYASYFIRNNKFICLPLIQCMSRSISGIYNLCYAIWLTFPLYWQRGNIIHRLFIDFPMKHAFTEQMLMLVWYYATVIL